MCEQLLVLAHETKESLQSIEAKGVGGSGEVGRENGGRGVVSGEHDSGECRGGGVGKGEGKGER